MPTSKPTSHLVADAVRTGWVATRKFVEYGYWDVTRHGPEPTTPKGQHRISGDWRTGWWTLDFGDGQLRPVDGAKFNRWPANHSAPSALGLADETHSAHGLAENLGPDAGEIHTMFQGTFIECDYWDETKHGTKPTRPPVTAYVGGQLRLGWWASTAEPVIEHDSQKQANELVEGDVAAKNSAHGLAENLVPDAGETHTMSEQQAAHEAFFDDGADAEMEAASEDVAAENSAQANDVAAEFIGEAEQQKVAVEFEEPFDDGAGADREMQLALEEELNLRGDDKVEEEVALANGANKEPVSANAAKEVLANGCSATKELAPANQEKEDKDAADINNADNETDKNDACVVCNGEEHSGDAQTSTAQQPAKKRQRRRTQEEIQKDKQEKELAKELAKQAREANAKAKAEAKAAAKAAAAAKKRTRPATRPATDMSEDTANAAADPVQATATVAKDTQEAVKDPASVAAERVPKTGRGRGKGRGRGRAGNLSMYFNKKGNGDEQDGGYGGTLEFGLGVETLSQNRFDVSSGSDSEYAGSPAAKLSRTGVKQEPQEAPVEQIVQVKQEKTAEDSEDVF